MCVRVGVGGCACVRVQMDMCLEVHTPKISP